MSQRTGQGFSLSVIVIAAIALVVMVILIALVINSGSNVNKNVGACAAISGSTCRAPGECPTTHIPDNSRGCTEAEKAIGYTQCCIPLS